MWRKIEKALEDWFRREGLEVGEGFAVQHYDHRGIASDSIEINLARLARHIEEEVSR